jgi:hypothetical protein
MTETPNLQSLFVHIDAPDEVIVRDHQGGEHHFKTLLPARRQLLVFRALAELIETVTAAPTDVAALARLLLSDDVAEQLGRTFRVAYDVAGDPLEQFPLEEIVAALVPLIARFIRRSASSV